MKLIRELMLENTAQHALEKWEDILHHIAEEELVACKVFDIILKKAGAGAGASVIDFIADCNDNVRKAGLQKDLSEKLTARLAKHDLPGLGKITARVYHENRDTR